MRLNSSKFKVQSSKFKVKSSGLSGMLYLSENQINTSLFSFFLILNSSIFSLKSSVFSLPSYIIHPKSFLFLLFSFFFSHVNAQIETKLDPEVILIGDTASLQITITADSRQEIILPQTSDSLNAYIEITGRKTDTLQRGNNLNIIQNFTITGFEPGNFLVNSLPVQIDGMLFQSEAKQIEIKDIEVEADADKMFPLKPIMPEEITFWEKYRKYFWYFVAALILAFVVGLIIWLYFKELRNRKKYVSTPLLPPYEEALDNLTKLDKHQYLDRYQFYEYYSDLNYILRRYFTRRFNFPANALLSGELPEIMHQKEILTEGEKTDLATFLQAADMAKYARKFPSEKEHKDFRNWAEEIIHKTRPVVDENSPEHFRNEAEEEKIRKIDNR